MAHADERLGLAELPRAECLSLLHSRQGGVGRLGFIADGKPHIVPVNYLLQGERLLFRTSSGMKFDAAVERRDVVFEVDQADDATQEGWSVVVAGSARVVHDSTMRLLLNRLGLSPFPFGRGEHWVVIEPEEISGRRIVRPYTW